MGVFYRLFIRLDLGIEGKIEKLATLILRSIIDKNNDILVKYIFRIILFFNIFL